MGIGAIVIATFCQTNIVRPDRRVSLAHSLPRLGQPEEHEEKVGQHFKTTNLWQKRQLIRIMVRRHEIALLHTPAEAAEILSIRESWLRGKAAARAIPCTFVGKHLRFSDDDIAQIMAEGARPPVTRRRGIRR
jgi:hypothetical protein